MPQATAPPNFLPIADPAAIAAAGVGHPKTTHGWRHLYKQRHKLGLAEAFVRVPKICVDIPTFLRLAREKAVAEAAAGDYTATASRARAASGERD